MLETSEGIDLSFSPNRAVAWEAIRNCAALGSLNLSIKTMWLWRRLVLDQNRKGWQKGRCPLCEDFRKCLMAVSAAGEYVDWLVGRQIGERDRAPCYSRLRAILCQAAYGWKDRNRQGHASSSFLGLAIEEGSVS